MFREPESLIARSLGLGIDEIKEVLALRERDPDSTRLRPEGAERKGTRQPPAQRISGLVELTAYAGGAAFKSEDGAKVTLDALVWLVRNS